MKKYLGLMLGALVISGSVTQVEAISPVFTGLIGMAYLIPGTKLFKHGVKSIRKSSSATEAICGLVVGGVLIAMSANLLEKARKEGALCTSLLAAALIGAIFSSGAAQQPVPTA